MPLVLFPASGSTVQKGVEAMQPLDCVINPSVVADLGSGVPGILREVMVDRSDLVKAGEVVAELESGVEIAALDLAVARAELTAEVDLRQVTAAFEQRQQKRTRDLFQRKAISANDMDQRRTEARLAQIQLRQARDEQALAELESLHAQEILQRRTIKSPIDGVVMERFRVIGEYIEDKPVVRVAQINPLHVEVIVPVQQLGMIRNGMRAKVSSETLEGASWQATVSRVDQVADVASGTYGVRLTMPNPGNKIPAGLRCRMEFLTDSAATAQTEPSPTVSIEASAPEMIAPQLATVEAPDALAVPDPVAVEQNLRSPAVASKYQAGPEMKLSPADPAAIKPPADRLCSWLGPYDSARAARLASKPLRVDGVDVSVHQRPMRKMVGFKIVSPPMYSKAALEAYLNRLRVAGVRDFVPLSINRGAQRVSLGVYRVRGPAEERVEKLQANGFEVDIEFWYERSDKHWLLVHGDASLLDTLLVHSLVDKQDENSDVGLCGRLASR